MLLKQIREYDNNQSLMSKASTWTDNGANRMKNGQMVVRTDGPMVVPLVRTDEQNLFRQMCHLKHVPKHDNYRLIMTKSSFGRKKRDDRRKKQSFGRT